MSGEDRKGAAAASASFKEIDGWLGLSFVILALAIFAILDEANRGFLWALAQGHDAFTLSAPVPATLGEKLALGFAVYCLMIWPYAVYCLFPFLRKDRRTPILMIVFYVLLLMMVAMNFGLLAAFPKFQSSDVDFSDAAYDLAFVAIMAGTQIPYFIHSVRVKNTFVN